MNIVKKMNKEHIGLLLILLVALYTRFYHLGYSDYIGDEHKAFYQPVPEQSAYNYLMNQRKGPMQFLVSHVPYLITGDFRNELAQRIPFAAISVVAIFVFYYFVRKVTGSKLISFLAAFLLTVNGFIVGFGRIAQYQSLNMLFSFLALYFYADVYLSADEKKSFRSSLLGTIFWSLSFLSHWDAIFILPVVVMFFGKFILNKNFSRKFRIKVILFNFLLGSLLLLPFLIPYTSYQLNNQENKTYFARRVEIGHYNLPRYLLLIELYNPFLLTFLLFVFGLSGIFLWKRSRLFAIWFFFAYAVFEILVRKPGTHLYNFIVPLLVLTAITTTTIHNHLKGWLRRLWQLLIFLVAIFLVYQTNFIFIDHQKEYPWEVKNIIDLTALQEERYEKRGIEEDERRYFVLPTPAYDIDQKLPLFGFPHRRYWNEINDYVNGQNALNNERLGYMSNEVKTISEWYMDAHYQADGEYYIIGVKRPLSFVEDYTYPQIGGKTTVHEIIDAAGGTLVRIYRVSGE